MTDPYERSAEFVDVMMAPHWGDLGPPLAEALQGFGPGPVVDLGAGGGLGTLVIAEALPDAEVVAIEPSPALRSVLAARVYERPGLRDRVTVLPGGLLQATLPAGLGGVVAMNVIGHLTPEERRALWRLLASGGRAVLNLQPPAEPVEVPMTRFADVRLGRHRYEGWGRAEPAGPGGVTWHMAYRVYEGELLVRETETAYAWRVLGERALGEELAEHGLGLTPTGPQELGMYIVEEDPHV
ncbi:class I SAM-dependent methyltransferase [Planomonospora sp. ID67723]|uniref:class I SAM-dependent methyltransferase n=1 Tax=Planomonospora sp. ID67723 TaxID=2738134 RepID=UPI0018C3D264|nr:class I SAM-dependent methyltransferase [Planomonospora sp. ID67723]MBG0832724.1 class I SAM-dependent methyltransferase [Planomonospora sp. ID67723]